MFFSKGIQIRLKVKKFKTFGAFKITAYICDIILISKTNQNNKSYGNKGI